MTERCQSGPCPNPEQLSAFVDNELGELYTAVAQHVARCTVCTRHVEELELINHVARVKAYQVSPPEYLRAGLASRLAAPGARTMPRRQVLGGLAVAATSVLAVGLWGWTSARVEAVESTLVRDFRKLATSDSRLDFESTSLSRTYAWFRARVGFELPAMPAIGQTGLRGARLCRLLDRDFAALHLGRGVPGMCLYIAVGDGLVLKTGGALPSAEMAAAMYSEHDIAGAFWQHDGLAYGLVGQRTHASIAREAAHLRAGATAEAS